MPALLKRPPQRVQMTMRLDPDLWETLGRLSRTKKMKKTDVFNQVFRVGLITIGESPKPAA